MEPKFQSSFIPKGLSASTVPASRVAPAGKKAHRGLFHVISSIIFTLSILAALGAFGYKYYLEYSIDKMGVDLEEARASLQLETIHEITSLNSRIKATEALISNHLVLTPLFEFLEESTPRTVRFTDFGYSFTEEGVKLSMRGEARGYVALALLSRTFDQSGRFVSSTFSNLALNESGDVVFSVDAVVDPSLVSYTSTIR